MPRVRFQVGTTGTNFGSEMPCLRPMVRRTVQRLTPWPLGVWAMACVGGEGNIGARPERDSVDVVAATAPQSGAVPQTRAMSAPPASASAPRPRAARPLSALEDTIAQRLVFAPVVQDWFTAAARMKRLHVDLGRLDIDLKKDPARVAAFQRAAAARSPFPLGTRFRIRGPWGAEQATLSAFDAYNGRIVATLEGAVTGDSLASVTDPLVAAAQRLPDGTPIAAAPGADASDADASGVRCERSADPAFSARLTQLAQLVEDSLRTAEDQPIYPRLKAALKARRSVAAGCFGEARGVVIVTLYAGDYEWVRERVLLVGATSVKRATVRDLRFRAHEALHALDADGDGIDDLAARAWTPRGGGTVILKLSDGTRFERLASGFAWER